MKKILSLMLALCVVLSLVLAFSSCKKDNNPDVPEGMKLASDAKVADYELFVPEDWIVTIQTGMTSAEVSETDHSSVSVTVFTNSSIPTGDEILSEYWKTYEKDLTTMFDSEKDTNGKDVTTYKAEEATSLTLRHGDENYSAEKHIFTGKVGGNSLKYMQIVSYFNDYFYLLTFTSTEEKFDSHLDSFEKIIANFELGK